MEWRKIMISWLDFHELYTPSGDKNTVPPTRYVVAIIHVMKMIILVALLPPSNELCRDKKVCGIACGGLHNAVWTETVRN
jgi:hypothetical protein